MALFQMRFHFPVEAIAVNGSAPSTVWVGALGEGTAIDKICFGRHIVMSAIATSFVDECAHVVLFFKRHVIASGSHFVSERWPFPAGFMGPFFAGAFNDLL